MNKIFKVVWSKSKECYVVVSEVAKNNGGKKKVLASVLAGLAMVGATAQMGTPVQAGSNTNGNNINVWSNQRVDTPTPGGPAVTNTNTQNTAGDNSVTIGQQLTTGTGAVAVGRLSTAAGDRAVAIGENVNAKKEDTISVGSSNNSNTGGGITIGKGNTADSTANGGRAEGNSQIAIGRDNKATKEDTLALGRANTASGNVSVAIGARTEATNSGSIAIAGNGDGYKTTSTGYGSIAIGMQSNSTGNASTAVGGVSQATADSASAFGRAANASAENATALGYNSAASVADGVALGSNSKATTAAGVAGYNPADSRTNTYAGLSGNAKTSTLAAVSVGDGSNATRQITGVAAGKEDTDAVNVAQLKNVNLKYAGNSGSGDVLLNNGTLNLKGEGLISTTADASGITVKIAKGDDITNNNGKAVAPSPNGVATTDNVVQAINKAGWNANASANGGTLTGTATATKVVPGDTVTFSAGKNLTVAQTLGTNTQQYTYALSSTLKDIESIQNGASKIALNNGGGTTISGGNLSVDGNKITNVAKGTDDTDAVNVKQLKDTELHITPGTYTPDANKKVKLTYTDGNNTVVTGKEAVIDLSSLATGGTASTESVVKKAAASGDTNIADVSVAGGKNVNDPGAQYEVSVSKNAVKDAAREAVTVNNGGNTDNPITVTPTKDDPNHTTSYAVTFDGDKAAKQIPLTYKANGSGDKTVKLDKGLDFTNGTNTTAEIGNDGVVKFNLNDNVALTNAGSLTVGGTTVNNGGLSITGGPSVTTGGIDAGSKKITNVEKGTADTDAVNVKQLKDTEKHIKPDTYTVANDGSVTLKYVDGNGTEQTETAKITGIAKKAKVVKGENTTVEEGTDATDNSVTYKVNVKGDLANISSITNGAGSGKISFAGDQVVNVEGDNPISLNGKDGYVTGLQNKDWDITNPTIVSGRAATEDQLKKVSDGFNNTVKLAGNTGNTDTQKLSQAGGLSFGVVGANNGEYIKTTASGTDVVADLSDTAKAKLNHTVEVAPGSSNVTVTPDTTDPNKTVYKVAVANTTGAASTESVVKKADAAGDTNIADVSVAGGKNVNDPGAQYEVSVSKNAVKDAAREAVTVNNGGNTDNPITVTPTKDDPNHTTSYAVTFDGDKAAKQIPLTYKANGSGDKTVKLDKGLDFTNGTNTTAEIGNDGVVKFNLNDNVALTNAGSLTVGGTTVNNGGLTITAPAGGTTSNVTLTQSGLDNGGNKIVNVKDGDVSATSKDAVNGSQLHAVKAAERHIAPTTGAHPAYTVDNDGNVTLDYVDGDGNATAEKAVIKGIAKQDLSNIDNAGKNVITGLGTVVKAGDNVTVSEASDATTGQKTYTVNAVTPAVYTKADGTKVYKIVDPTTNAVTYNTKPDGTGTAVPANDVIVSIEDAAGNTTGGNSIVNNVGSAIDKTGTSTGDTFLTKLDTAATNTPNAAVNVKDLKNTSDAIIGKGLKFDANSGGEKSNKLGSKVTVKGEGTKADTEYNGTNIKTIIAQTGDDTTIDVKLAKDLTGINSIANTAGGPTMTFGGNSINITGGNLDLGNNNITNLAPGTGDNDAVNVKQLKDTELHITPGTYTPGSDKKVKLTYTDGNNQVVNGKEAVIDLSGITTGGTASSWNVKSSANTTDGGAVADTHDANAQNIADTKTVEFQSGKNLVVKQTNDTTNGNATVEFSLSDNITAGKDGANGKDGSVGATGKDGASVVLNGKDGSIGMTGPKGQDGKDGINGRDGANISITSAKGEQVLTNRDPAHNSDTDKAERIVYVPKDANGNPIQGADGKNIVREVATMDDGLKFTGNNESTVNKQQLGSLVKVQGEGTKEGTDTAGAKEIQTSDGTKFESAKDNIAVEADGANTLTVKLNKDLKGLNSVTTEKVITKEIDLSDPHGTTTATIKYDDNRITYTNDGGQHEYKVANLNDEKHITQGVYTVGDKSIDSKAANDEVTLTYTSGYDELIRDKDGNPITTKIKGIAKSDLSNITDAGKKVITGLGTVVKAGDNVTVTDATDATTGQKTYTVNAVTPAVYTKADGTKVYKVVNPTTGAVTFNTNPDGTGTEVPANDVIVSFQDAAGNTTGGSSIVNNVGSAIDKTGTSTGDTFLTNLNDAATATPFAAVNVRDLKSTADALKASELHIAPTAVKAGSTEAKGGAASGAENVYKYDAATKKVTLTYNDGNGKAVTDTKAVIDFTDLNVPAGGNNYGFKANATANGGTVEGTATETAVENGGTVNFAAGKNLTVKQDLDATNKTHTYTFSLDKDLTNLDKVVVNGKDGIAGKDGVTIVGPQGATGATGIPGTNGIDGKVGITGKDGKDAVSIAGKDGVGTIGLTGPQGPAGTNGKSVDISTENGTKTLFKPEANNNDQSQRIVYVPKDANGNPLKDADNNDIKREVATMDDGLRFTGNNTSTENKQKLGSLVKVEGEGVTEAQANSFQSAAGNIAVVANGADTLTVKLNKDLKGLDSVTTKEVKLGDANDNISIKKDGDRITYSTDGGTTVNKVANLADEQHIKDTTYTVDTDKKVKLTYVDGNGKDVTGKTAIIDLSNLPVGDKDTDMRIKEGDYTAKNGSVTLNTVDKDGNPVAGKDVVIKGINTNNYQAGDNVTFTNDGNDANGNPIVKINADVSTEKVEAKAVAGNLAKVTGKTGTAKGETYEVAVTKGDIENNAEISYKASTSTDPGSQTAKKTTLANGFDFTSDDHSVAITTGANGKVNFKVDTTGVQGKAFNLDVNSEGTGKVENAQTAATTPSVEKGTKFVAGNNLSIRHDAINGNNNYDHQVTYALNSDLKGITSITNNGGATMNFGPNEISMTGGNLNMGDNKITNVKNGTDKSDVATVGQLTKVTSNDNSVSINKSTDADGAPVYDLSVQGGRDPRVDELGEEIGRVGAQGAALAALNPIQYDPLEPTQIMAGYGNYRGNSAIAMGVAHYKNESTLMHAGLSWAGGSRHMMANAGVTWKVGNRDSEAAVADRYRKGPISSAYAMQQEMASVKAQNAGLKTEVSDLKAENEQMKAQIAAMMAKLGM